MRILLIAVGSHGDVHPFVGIGLALRARGHSVSLAAAGVFRSLVERAGLRFVELGSSEAFGRINQNPDLWHPLKGVRVVFGEGVLPQCPRAYALVCAFLREGPGVVVTHALGFGALAAQEKYGISLATVQLAPAAFRSFHQSPRLPGVIAPQWLPRAVKQGMWTVADRLVLEPVITRPFNSWRRSIGLPPVRDLLGTGWHSRQRVLALFPAWFGPPQPDWPAQVRLCGFPLYDERGLEPMPAALDAFLACGARPVAFTPGSAMLHGQEFFTQSVAACERAGVRGILLTRHGAQIPAALPERVIHVPFAPFSELLPRCAAVVHHGGIGSTAQGLAAGVPQLLMPMAHDQFDNAERVKRLGVGLAVPRRGYRAERVGRILRQLIEAPAWKRRAEEVAGRIHGGEGIANACREIESLPPRGL